MTEYRPVYRNIKDWAILDKKTVYAFNSDETPIDIVEVLIGTLHYEMIDFNKNCIERRTPITRWITKKEYDYLNQNEDTIIW